MVLLRSSRLALPAISSSPSSYMAKLCRAFSDVIGIDLGTTNSRVAIMEGKTAKVIENSQGARTTPSVVSFSPKGGVLVGISSDPINTIFATKRFIGKAFHDPLTQQNMGPFVQANGTLYTPDAIRAFIVTKLKETAEAYLGKTVSKAVITVPASFHEFQIDRTWMACKLAGLDVQSIIDESSAAVLSYATSINRQGGLIAIVDFGGGTFDVSIFEISHGLLKLRATRGDTSLGGLDFDKALVEFLASECKRREGVDLSSDTLALDRLREAAEKAKIQLSSATQTDVHLTAGGKHLSVTLTRAKFESLVGGFIERTKSLCKSCVEDAKIVIEDLDEVLLVGGMARVPKVEEVVSEVFGKKPSKGVNGDEAVVMGAAIQGGIVSAPKAEDYTLRLWRTCSYVMRKRFIHTRFRILPGNNELPYPPKMSP